MFLVKNKSILTISLLVLTVSFHLTLLNDTYAITCGGAETNLISCEEGGDGGIFHILSLSIDILSIGIGIVSVVATAWAGIIYLTAGDSTEKTTKAKRRMYEIVIGISCYAVLFGIIHWLLPGSTNLGEDNNDITKVSIKASKEGVVGKTIKVTVSLDKNAKDKTYSLLSSDSNIISTIGTSAKCVSEGKATISAIASNGKKASTSINCTDDRNDNEASSGNSNTNTEIVGNMMNTKFTGNSNGKPHIRKQTKKIIEEHNKDFYRTGDKSYEKVVLGKNSKYGSYKNYVKSLGGVFEQFADTKRINVKTAADFQIAAEYVFGLFKIWGEDYYNYASRVYWSTDDAFYQGYSSRGSIGVTTNSNVDKVLSNGYKNTINTHCDKGINILIKSTKLKYPPGGSSNGNDSNNRKLVKGGFIRNVEKLQVGDIVNFPGHHTVIVGEVYKDKVILYDVGRIFQQKSSHTYKYAIPRNTGNRFGPDTRYYGMSKNWYAWRIWDIDQNKTLGGING